MAAAQFKEAFNTLTDIKKEIDSTQTSIELSTNSYFERQLKHLNRRKVLAETELTRAALDVEAANVGDAGRGLFQLAHVQSVRMQLGSSSTDSSTDSSTGETKEQQGLLSERDLGDINRATNESQLFEALQAFNAKLRVVKHISTNNQVYFGNRRLFSNEQIFSYNISNKFILIRSVKAAKARIGKSWTPTLAKVYGTILKVFNNNKNSTQSQKKEETKNKLVRGRATQENRERAAKVRAAREAGERWSRGRPSESDIIARVEAAENKITKNYDSGWVYCGQWEGGKKHGYGTYTGAIESGKYLGEWKNDKYDGYGTGTWANGSKFVGEWKNGKRHGNGTYTYANGTIKHSGEWVNGEPKKEGETKNVS